MRIKTKTFASILLFSVTLVASADRVQPIDVQRKDIVIETIPESFHADIGETVSFKISLKRNGETVIGQTMEYKLSWDTSESIKTQKFETAEQPMEVSTTATKPGFIRLIVYGVGLEHNRDRRNEAGVAVHPEEIQSAQFAPDDFDAFWNAKRELVYSTPIFPIMNPVSNNIANFETFDLQINAPGGLNCSGYYGRPANAEPKSLPAILYVHASGVYSSWIEAAELGASFNALVYDLNSHGVPNGKAASYYQDLFNGPLFNYWSKGLSDPEDCYFLGIYLRMLRALQFLKDQPEWDGKTLIVRGGSEGGGLAIAAAGLDLDVSLFVAEIPGQCDQMGFLIGHPVGHPWAPFNGNPPLGPITTYDEQAAQTWSYFDAVNFGKRTNASAIVTVGFIDSSVPPTSVYAMFNTLLSEDKIMLEFPDMGHGFPGSTPNMRGIIDGHMLRFIKDGKLK